MQLTQINLSRPRACREVRKVHMERQNALKVADSVVRPLLPFSHPSSRLEHAYDDGQSCRNQENGSNLGCNPSEADMETRIGVQVV